MSNTAELCARLLEHAAIHDRETSPYSPEQAAWAADLRDAAALIQAAPVVERADSATAVVERGAGNVSDNAATVAPARWYCVTNYGGATLCTGRDDAAEVAAEQDIAVPPHGPHRAVMLAEVPPARGPLYDQAALDAALNLWPPDCRLCANFTTKTGGCVSVVQCVDSMQFKATPPRQYWASAPNAAVNRLAEGKPELTGLLRGPSRIARNCA